MSALSAVVNADKTVTLNATGMPAVGTRTALWHTISGWVAEADTTISNTAGDTYGPNVQMTWAKGSSSQMGAYSTRTGLVAGQYYAFRISVRLDVWDPDLLQLDPPPPLEVWLDTNGSKPWGEDPLTRRVIHPRRDDDADPYAYEELWLFMQATAASNTVHLRARPLYGHVTNATLYWRAMSQYENAIDPRRSVPRIFRTDSNGRRELQLDYIPGDSPVATSYGPVTDHEAALAGAVTYELVDVGGNSIAVDATAAVDLGGTPATKPRLSRSSTGESVELELVTAYTAERESTGTVHRVLDRTAPIVLEGALADRAGELEVWAKDYPTALEVVGILQAGTELIYRQATHPGMDLRFVPRRVSERPATDDGARWLVTCSYLEVSD